MKLNHTQDVTQRLQIVSNMVEQLSDGEKFYISQKLKVRSRIFCRILRVIQTLTPGDARERLVLTVAVLRELFEVKNREQQLVNGLKKVIFRLIFSKI